MPLGLGFLDFNQDFLCALCLLCSAREQEVHRRDAEEFWILGSAAVLGMGHLVWPGQYSRGNEGVGCKEGRGRRENRMTVPVCRSG